jgi:hypothetical protein
MNPEKFEKFIASPIVDEKAELILQKFITRLKEGGMNIYAATVQARQDDILPMIKGAIITGAKDFMMFEVSNEG